MSSGVVIKLEQGPYKTKPAKIKRINSNSFLIIINEGKKRQIRRMCEALGYKVMKLKRIRILGIRLGNLKPNNLSKIDSKDVQKLLSLLGL
jgi:23S rRNA pseudouridine2604 synthase